MLSGSHLEIYFSGISITWVVRQNFSGGPNSILIFNFLQLTSIDSVSMPHKQCLYAPISKNILIYLVQRVQKQSSMNRSDVYVCVSV